MDLTSLKTQLDSIVPIDPPTKKKKKVKKGEGGKKKKVVKKKLLHIGEDFVIEDRPPEPDEPESSRLHFRKYTSEDFELLNLLGEGGFGKVFLSKLYKHNAYFAIKFMDKKRIIESNDFESVLIEKKVLLYGNRNPFICRLFCSFQTKSYLCFVMEFCCGGDLKFQLNKERRFDESKVRSVQSDYGFHLTYSYRFYLAEISSALSYLHKLGIIYRDLKLDNVMIAANGHLKLVDFGLCLGKIYRKELMPSDFCGTVEYIAPEVIKGERYNQSVDYWSLGIVAYEMSIGDFPFTGTEEEEICWFICNQNIRFPFALPPDLQNLIVLLLNKNPGERIGMSGSPHGRLKDHKFFSGINWTEVEECRTIPPYIPCLQSTRDTSHFGSEAYLSGTKRIRLIESGSPIDFPLPNFDYTNPNMTD